MIAPTSSIEWRIGGARIALSATVHGVATIASIVIALDWRGAWFLLGVVGLSAVEEAVRWFRERGQARTLGLFPGGIVIDALRYQAWCAWLGPGWTAVWLTTGAGRRRLLHVMRGEVTEADHAVLRRHVRCLESM